ncbi:MAG: DUF4065 domain-containing protein [Alphaproteobacteria bacterium]
MTKEYKKYTPEAVANNILWLAREEGKPVTPMQLIKLVYICYGWVLALLHRKLFDAPIEAWQHGPVIPQIYGQFQRFGKTPIDTFASEAVMDNNGYIIDVRYPVVDPGDKEVHALISTVWNSYKDCDAWTLSDITHEDGGAWYNAKKKGLYTKLDDKDIVARSLEGIKKKYGKK